MWQRMCRTINLWERKATHFTYKLKLQIPISHFICCLYIHTQKPHSKLECQTCYKIKKPSENNISGNGTRKKSETKMWRNKLNFRKPASFHPCPRAARTECISCSGNLLSSARLSGEHHCPDWGGVSHREKDLNVPDW